MAQSIQNVVLVGAAGSVGEAVLAALVASKKFNIKIIRRLGSTSAAPDGITVEDVDFDSHEALVKSLEGQDAVVSTVGGPGVPVQKNFIDAAVTAGVQRFIPSDFGSNLYHPSATSNPIFAQKLKILAYLVEQAKASSLTWTSVATNALLDWGIEHDFILNFSEYKPSIIDGGDFEFTTTRLTTAAEAVVQILLKPEETKNRAVYLEDYRISQNQFLALAQKVAPNKPWQVNHITSQDLTKVGEENLAKGLMGPETFLPFVFRAAFTKSGGGDFDVTDNELLGLKRATEEDILGLLRAHLK
ncbi:hypothetical protein VHEMI02198 [[Torrubiella] hemipterigena]|uniref:NmrA-like domain-containing protein n=1 Tax=[Torrubiella] hemipterigena TaxID=1531966 RepID=A0A0A1SV56_9HYPO|nr:hypothetical protein VHEMI02198 [[Torrubiella] hemipterigena]